MAIVRMNHLELIASASVLDELMRDMSRLGCVEITQAGGSISDDEALLLSKTASDSAELRAKSGQIRSAIEILGKYARIKRGLFQPRRRINEDELFDSRFLQSALDLSESIVETEREIGVNLNEVSRLKNRKESLMPWKNLDVPLDVQSTQHMSLTFATAPAAHQFAEIESAVAAVSDTAELFLASSGREAHYFMIMCHGDDVQAVYDALRPYGFSRTQFKDVTSTAAANISETDGRINELEAEREKLKESIVAQSTRIGELEACADAFDILLRRALACEKLMSTKSTVLLEGWFPEREAKKLSELLDMYGCAYEMRAPNDDEEPPILTYNLKLFAPFGIITNMYSPPSYRGIDPNPFMAPFFAVFFGIMLSDAAYGLLMVLAGAIVLFKFKPRGGIKQAMILVTICGVSTFVWGALFGGFFGDAIGSVYKLVTGETFTVDTALWFNPLNDPMKMLVFSFVLGGIHIFAGMAIQAYMLIRDGHFWDAVFDIGFWWLVLAGAVFLILGMVPLGGALAGAGAIGLILTQGRHEKKLLKKFTKGISSLYDITSYLGDILSYSRLLALSLATAVVASVMNTMGVLTGPIGFIFVFLIGHTFNIAINLVGSYVHTARLQYVEFFGKFYQSGGTLFEPLDTQTKYVDIIKEEH